PSDIQYLNVLVVDDCADSRVIMQKMLESFGFRVKSVSSGEESLHMLGKNLERGKPFDLVMMDWLMPGLDGIEASRRIRKDLKLTTPIIMMTAFGKVNEKMEAERAGVNGFLTKPVYQSTLFNAIMNTFGKQGIRGAEEEKYIAAKVPVYEERLKGLRILVVEDNPVNQEIAKAILEKAEIIVDVANNGEEAVEAVRQTYFDAVLMDVQMPKMDGYEATRTIRKDPKFNFLPIIAMTAHAMKGDEEKCLEAGMNAYVSKPVSQERLFRTLWELVKPGKRRETVESATVEKPGEEVERVIMEAEELPLRLPGINIQDALKSLNISNDIFKRILMGFLKNNRDTGVKIRDALERKDWDAMLHLAHSLKGSAGNIGAKKLYKNAQNLETAGRNAKNGLPTSLEGISDLIDKVEAGLNEVLDSLESLVKIKDKELYEKEEKIKLSAEPAQILAALKRLAGALDVADPQEIKNHMDVLKGDLSGAIFQELENLVNTYDYDEAVETLKGIMEKIKAAAAEKGDENENR
ncbi:MAG: response regulator, partial [Deltaproteobacteria bacterium]|nr:response regulator [Deltaproteobacteria bacterium]